MVLTTRNPDDHEVGMNCSAVELRCDHADVGNGNYEGDNCWERHHEG